MDNSTIFLNVENPRRGRQARNLSETDPKILDLKSSSEQIIFRKLSLGAPVFLRRRLSKFVFNTTGDIRDLWYLADWTFLSAFSDINNANVAGVRAFLNRIYCDNKLIFTPLSIPFW